MFSDTPQRMRATTCFLCTVMLLVLAGCGNQQSASTPSQPASGELQHVDGTVALNGKDITVTSSAGTTTQLKLGTDVAANSIRALQASGETVRVYTRGDIAVKVEQQTRPKDALTASGNVVEARSTSLSITSAEGTKLVFTIAPENREAFDTAHLLEHKAERAPITVYYRKNGSQLSALAYEDA